MNTIQYSGSSTNLVFQQIAKFCPVTNTDSSDIITVVIDEQNLIGKHFMLLTDGSIKKNSAVSIARGVACQFHVPDHHVLLQVLRIVSDNPSSAIINSGWKPAVIGEPFVFLSKKALEKLGLKPEDVTTDGCMIAFARLKFHARPSRWQLLDRDEDSFTPEWAVKQTFKEWLKNLNIILPGIEKVRMLRAHSSSARILRPDGKAIAGGNGHIWIKVKDATDSERTRTAISARALEHNLTWTKPRISKSNGLECGRGFATIVDSSVWTIGRLVFVGQPTCSPTLKVTHQEFEQINGEEEVLDTSNAIVSRLKTFQAASTKGVHLRLSPKGSGYRSIIDNLRFDTELELEDGSIKTVSELTRNYSGKIRCQAPFRASTSMAAFMAINDRDEPFVYDSGTDTRHTLTQSPRSKNSDKVREKLINEIRHQLGKMIPNIHVCALLDVDVLGTAFDCCFYIHSTTGKITLINQKSELVDLAIGDFSKFGIRRIFGNIINDDLLSEVITENNLDKEASAKLLKLLDDINRGYLLIEYLKLYKQAKSLSISVDMFATRGFLTVDDSVATITFPHRCFVPKRIIEIQIVESVMKDYLQHFPEFNDFLYLILYARFATDRRNAFIWLHSPSSWGKGFLVSVFRELLLVVEVQPAEIERALAGGPVGLSLIDTLRAWILFADEFKKASSELKLLNSQITISPKNQLRCLIQLYTKVFASAENVRSLVGGGVDEQFDNRFAYLSPITCDQKIEDRKLFQEVGKTVYLAAIVNFVAEFLNIGVERLRKLGAIESSKEADTFVKSYQANRRLNSTFGNLADTVEEIVEEIRNCLIDFARWAQSSNVISEAEYSVQGLSHPLLNMLKRKAHVGWVSEGHGSRQRHMAIVLGDPVSFIQGYLALSENRSTIGKLQYKADQIAAVLHMRPESHKGKVRVYQLVKNDIYKVIANKCGVVIFLDHQPVNIDHYEFPSDGTYSE